MAFSFEGNFEILNFVLTDAKHCPIQGREVFIRNWRVCVL